MKPIAKWTTILLMWLIALFVGRLGFLAEHRALAEDAGQNAETPGIAITRPIPFDTPDSLRWLWRTESAKPSAK